MKEVILGVISAEVVCGETIYCILLYGEAKVLSRVQGPCFSPVVGDLAKINCSKLV